MQANPESTQRQIAPETAASTNIENTAEFPPLPLRPRGILELLDVSIKVYKQYFVILMSWSALVVSGSILAGLVGFVVPFGGSLPSILLTPLMTGVVACCLAAGVRGQRVEFSQCWRFTKPRFWPMVGLSLLASLIMMLALLAFCLVGGLVGGAGYLLVRNAPENVQIALGIIGGLLLLTAGTIFGTVVIAWTNLVTVVVCMEPDKMNTRALGRAYELIRGQWMKAFTLLTMVGFGVGVLYVILWGAGALLVGLTQLKGIANGQTIDTSTWIEIVGFFLLNGVLYIIYKPIFSLIMNLFYLDMRVRHEALDLEWNAHVTAPPMATLPAAPAASVQLPTGFAAANPSSAAAPYVDAYTTYEAAPPAVVTPSSFDAMAPAPPVAASQNPVAQSGVAPAFSGASAPAGAVEPALAGEMVATANPALQIDATPQSQTIICPKCAAVSPASYLFCMKCGTKLRDAASNSRW